MRPRPDTLINTPEIEIWPAHLVRARGNNAARELAGAERVLRRKHDGRFLLATCGDAVRPLSPAWRREPGLDGALRALATAGTPQRHRDLPLARLAARLGRLGLDAAAYEARTGLSTVAEPSALAFAGRDRYRRPLWLRPAAARAWQAMRADAMRDGVVLDAISGYRSHDYQLGIFARKLARGLGVDEILTVNAAPGYSEHHGGRALDIGTPGEPPAEESFEATPAFDWLVQHAARHGFRMSYPRDNPHGIVYEPWHWCLAPGITAGRVE
ncbi:M15 family metallopeptidase [Lysobacter xanthus]